MSAHKKPKTRHGSQERAVRLTFWPPPEAYKAGHRPATSCALERDMKVSAEEYAATVAQGGVFMVVDVFRVPADTSLHAAGLLAQHRHERDREDEENMAKAYHWWVMTIEHTGRGAYSRIPAPLSTDQIADVLRQVALHPSYGGQTVQAFDRNGSSVRLEAGAVVRGGAPIGPGPSGGAGNLG